MRKWVSAVAIVVALASPTPALAEDSPPKVYSDFAEDGVLSCGHSRSALKRVLNDATLHQYGDPFTLVGLKVAIRRRLAGGCRRNDRTTALFATRATDQGSGAKRSTDGKKTTRPRTTNRLFTKPTGPTTVREEPDSPQDGRMVVLGVALLLLTLGSGGWAARRAFTDRP